MLVLMTVDYNIVYLRVNLLGLVKLLVEVNLSAGRECRSAGAENLSVGLMIFPAVTLKTEEVLELFLTQVTGISGENFNMNNMN
jgi:hypothetical protein